MAQPKVVLKPGREGPVEGRHPWVFSGAIDRVEGDPEVGTEVAVATADGRTIARGLWND